MCVKDFCDNNHDDTDYYCFSCGKRKGLFTLGQLMERDILYDIDDY